MTISRTSSWRTPLSSFACANAHDVSIGPGRHDHGATCARSYCPRESLVPWRVALASDAERALHRLRGPEVERMNDALDALDADPSRGVKAAKAITRNRE